MMKVNESAVLKGSEALQLYVDCLAMALGELSVQASRLRDETNTLADVVAESSREQSVRDS
jgi:hypothetical protein